MSRIYKLPLCNSESNASLPAQHSPRSGDEEPTPEPYDHTQSQPSSPRRPRFIPRQGRNKRHRRYHQRTVTIRRQNSTSSAFPMLSATNTLFHDPLRDEESPAVSPENSPEQQPQEQPPPASSSYGDQQGQPSRQTDCRLTRGPSAKRT